MTCKQQDLSYNHWKVNTWYHSILDHILGHTLIEWGTEMWSERNISDYGEDHRKKNNARSLILHSSTVLWNARWWWNGRRDTYKMWRYKCILFEYYTKNHCTSPAEKCWTAAKKLKNKKRNEDKMVVCLKIPYVSEVMSEKFRFWNMRYDVSRATCGVFVSATKCHSIFTTGLLFCK